MKQRLFYRIMVPLVGLCLLAVKAGAAEPLSLAQAEALALANDPLVQAYQANTTALRARSVAADTLPDPKLKLGLVNFPTDTYKRDQEAMTQVQVGIQQMFPRGNSLEIAARRMNFMADSEAARAVNQYRRVRQQVRQAWLEVLYWEQAAEVVQQNQALFKRLVDTLRSQYATGRHQQQDLIRAQLELGMLEDRLHTIGNMIDSGRARLSRLLGENVARTALAGGMPTLPAVPDRAAIAATLETHPALQMQQAMLSASEQGVALARQGYRPEWVLDLTYGARDGNNPNGSARADFVSAVVSIDIPLFIGNRQDKSLAASQAERQSAILTREDRKRALLEQLDDAYATWQRQADRLHHYRSTLVPAARENAAASMHAYQNERGDFATLMRAQITELETSLMAVRLQVDHQKTQASLLYLSGEES
ncbi:MAG: TolC family protein [Gammaproteobacteria bacterium]